MGKVILILLLAVFGVFVAWLYLPRRARRRKGRADLTEPAGGEEGGSDPSEEARNALQRGRELHRTLYQLHLRKQEEEREHRSD